MHTFEVLSAILALVVITFLVSMSGLLHFQDKYSKAVYTTCIMTKVKILSDIWSCRLIEWIEYNKQIGFDHIFLSEDCSDLNFGYYQYYDESFVTVIPTYDRYNRDCTNHKPHETRNTRKVFEKFVRHRCEWVMALDLDEYITFWNTSTNLSYILQSANLPLFRFHSWKMGSDSRESVSKGLLIESSKTGEFEMHHHKAIARSNEVKIWWFQHFPVMKHPKRKISSNMTLGEFVDRLAARPSEYTLVHNTSPSLSSSSFLVPATSAFIKHYKYTSYEEFLAMRAKYNLTAGGRDNPYRHSPRIHWLSGNFSNPDIAVSFTHHMAAQLRKALSERELAPAIAKNCVELWGGPGKVGLYMLMKDDVAR